MMCFCNYKGFLKNFKYNTGRLSNGCCAFYLEFLPITSKITTMDNQKMYIIMVGLPARGKSTIANKLKEYLVKDNIRTRIFNNGDLRRKLFREDTSRAEFYDPENREALALREKIALMNIQRANNFISGRGQVAILDATNVSQKRREKITGSLNGHPLLFIECINNDEEILEASILRKTSLPEFSHLKRQEAVHQDYDGP